MKPSDEFFSGQRYAVFGVKAPGRSQGPILVAALAKAGKTPIAIEPEGEPIKHADIARSLAEALPVDGVVLLPPAPWNHAAAELTADAARQCKENGFGQVWVYTAGDPAPAMAIVRAAGLDPSDNRCPCLHVVGAGFPHNLHQFFTRLGRRG